MAYSGLTERTLILTSTGRLPLVLVGVSLLLLNILSSMTVTSVHQSKPDECIKVDLCQLEYKLMKFLLQLLCDFYM